MSDRDAQEFPSVEVLYMQPIEGCKSLVNKGNDQRSFAAQPLAIRVRRQHWKRLSKIMGLILRSKIADVCLHANSINLQSIGYTIKRYHTCGKFTRQVNHPSSDHACMLTLQKRRQTDSRGQMFCPAFIALRAYQLAASFQNFLLDRTLISIKNAARIGFRRSWHNSVTVTVKVESFPNMHHFKAGSTNRPDSVFIVLCHACKRGMF
jgi:hypothetical protein